MAVMTKPRIVPKVSGAFCTGYLWFPFIMRSVRSAALLSKGIVKSSKNVKISARCVSSRLKRWLADLLDLRSVSTWTLFVLICDRGNNSRAKFDALQAHAADDSHPLRVDVIGGLVAAHHRDLLRKPLKAYSQTHKNLRVWTGKRTVYGLSAIVVMTYHPGLAARQRRGTFVKWDARNLLRSLGSSPTNNLVH